MAKRIMAVVIGAGMGGLGGLLLSFAGLGNRGLFLGAGLGAILPLVVLGRPGR